MSRGLGDVYKRQYSKRLQAGSEGWPDCVLLMGDQVYADEVPPDTKEFMREREERDRAGRDRGEVPPPGEVANFEEYTRLHRESWSEPDIRWLLATVPSTMIFDDHDHLILASTLPVFMAPAIHHLQAWNERVCDGAWGGPAASLGERIRQGLDLDHWPSFARSFRRMEDLLRLRGGDEDGPPPASILLLGGDVHTAYVAEVGAGPGVRSRVWQLVCSPFRKPLDPRQRRLIRALFTRPARALTSAMARAAHAPRPSVSWHVRSRPTFDNSIGLIEVEGRSAHVAIRRTTEHGDPTRLSALHEVDLTAGRPVRRRGVLGGSR